MTQKQEEQVGDINSSARGTGARFNAGKPDMSLWPLGVLGKVLEQRGLHKNVVQALQHIQDFQFGGTVDDLYKATACLRLVDDVDIYSTTRVLEYGMKKYAAWNWAKGMAWSICLACIGRHAEKTLRDPFDEETGLPHTAHMMCNILFLIFYVTYYPEGDDRYKPSPVVAPTEESTSKITVAANRRLDDKKWSGN